MDRILDADSLHVVDQTRPSVRQRIGENGMAKQVFYGEIQNGFGLHILMANSVETDSKNRIVLSMKYYDCKNYYFNLYLIYVIILVLYLLVQIVVCTLKRVLTLYILL